MELTRNQNNSLVFLYNSLPDNMIGDVRKDQEVRVINQFVKLADKLKEANKPFLARLDTVSAKQEEIQERMKAEIKEDKSNIGELQKQGQIEYDIFLKENMFEEFTKELITVELDKEEEELLKTVFEKHGGKVNFPKGVIPELSNLLGIK